ncbi:MAG: sigma-54 dependent transcriptional regulator, partial [Desulfobacterales bacterium]
PSKNFSEVAAAFQKSNAMVEFVVLTPQDQIRQGVKALKSGASDYLTCPIVHEEVLLVIAAFQETLAKDLELDYLRDQFWKTDWISVIRTNNPKMRKIFEDTRAVAPTIATVLLLGETGTGKGLLARLIHWHSNRYAKPFIAVHCGAIPDTLIESELFGHEKGAFTGAERIKRGKFEIAGGGTIFLDEIGTITPAAQVKLLQVLQDGTFSRLGSETQIQADVRIIAATNDDIRKLCDQGRFRKDLFYRLNVFPLEAPPLRQRLEDLPSIVKTIQKNLDAKYGKSIYRLHPSVMDSFRRYNWPGNIRELENVLERAYILENNSTLMPQSFPREIVGHKSMPSMEAGGEILPLADARRIIIEDFERHYIKTLVDRYKGKIGLSAEQARITPRQLNRLMARYEIRKEDYKD